MEEGEDEYLCGPETSYSDDDLSSLHCLPLPSVPSGPWTSWPLHMRGEVDLCGHGGASFSSLLKGHSSYYTVAFMLRPHFAGVAHGLWLSTVDIPELDHPCPMCMLLCSGPTLAKTSSEMHCRRRLSLATFPFTCVGPASQAEGPPAPSCFIPHRHLPSKSLTHPA